MGDVPEMVEKVARAICKSQGADPDFTGYQQGPADDARPAWQRQIGIAQAAIEAMRDATKEMLEAGNYGIDDDIDYWNYDSGSGYRVEPQAAFNVWQRMIDVALASQGNGRER